MKKILLIILLTGSIIMSADRQKELEKNIHSLIEKTEGYFAVAFYDLSTGQKILINEKENFHAASTMKTPVMIEVFKQAEAGKLSLEDSIIIKNEFRSIVDSSVYSMDISDDGGEELYSFIGKKRTIVDLVYDMITVSSNLATNILIELVNAENVMNTMKEIGADDIKVLRGVEDSKAFQKKLNNTTTAYDLMLIFEKIARKEIVSEKSCMKMIEILSEQKFRDIIPAKLPVNIKVAHKTGSITGVQHDSGIVFLPDGREYILILLSKNLFSAEAGVETLSEISKLIYEFMTNRN